MAVPTDRSAGPVATPAQRRSLIIGALLYLAGVLAFYVVRVLDNQYIHPAPGSCARSEPPVPHLTAYLVLLSLASLALIIAAAVQAVRVYRELSGSGLSPRWWRRRRAALAMAGLACLSALAVPLAMVGLFLTSSPTLPCLR